MDDKKELAITEIQMVQQVIQQQTDLRNRIVAWSVTLNTAIVVALSSQTIQLSKERYLIVAVVVTLVFFWLDTIHKVTENRAIDRSNAIESYLRGEGGYNGPQLGLSLSKPNTLAQQIRVAKLVRVWGPHVGLLATILGAYFVA